MAVLEGVKSLDTATEAWGGLKQTGRWTWAGDQIRHEMKGQTQTKEKQLKADTERYEVKKGGENTRQKNDEICGWYLNAWSKNK